jgi:hypothetical protein
MKKLLVIVLALFAINIANAQVSEGKLEIDKVEHPAVMGVFLYPPEIVTGVLQEDLKSKGFGKGDEKKDIYRFEGIEFSQISKEKIDFFYKVIQSDKKDPNKTTIYLLVKKADNNFVSSSVGSDVYSATISYLTSLTPKFELKKLEQAIEKQEVLIKETEQKVKDAEKTKKELEEQKKKLEDQIKQNQK